MNPIYSYNSTQLSGQDNLLAEGIANANIKFHLQMYDAYYMAVLPRIYPIGQSVGVPVECSDACICSRRAMHISCRLAPGRDATAAKPGSARSSLDENTAVVSVNRPLAYAVET